MLGQLYGVSFQEFRLIAVGCVYVIILSAYLDDIPRMTFTAPYGISLYIYTGNPESFQQILYSSGISRTNSLFFPENPGYVLVVFRFHIFCIINNIGVDCFYLFIRIRDPLKPGGNILPCLLHCLKDFADFLFRICVTGRKYAVIRTFVCRLIYCFTVMYPEKLRMIFQKRMVNSVYQAVISGSQIEFLLTVPDTFQHFTVYPAFRLVKLAEIIFLMSGIRLYKLLLPKFPDIRRLRTEKISRCVNSRFQTGFRSVRLIRSPDLRALPEKSGRRQAQYDKKPWKPSFFHLVYTP